MKCLIVVLVILISSSLPVHAEWQNGTDELSVQNLRDVYCRTCKKPQQKVLTCGSIQCTCRELTLESHSSPLKLPKIFCKEDNLISLSWATQNEYVYSLEVEDSKSKFFTEITQCGYYVIRRLTEGSKYRIRLWAISKYNNTAKKTDFLIVNTLLTDRKILPVSSVTLDSIKPIAYNHLRAIIRWTPSKDQTCYYGIVRFNQNLNSMGDIEESEINYPTFSHETKIDNLTFSNNYSVSIMAISLSGHEESEKKWVNFTTPSCQDTYHNLKKCKPNIPNNLEVQEYVVKKELNFLNSIFDVELSWDLPELKPNYYIAVLSNLKGNASNHISLNISGIENSVIFSNVSLSMHYQVSLTAWSEAGQSLTALQYCHINESSPMFVIPVLEPRQNLDLILIVSSISLLLVGLVCFIFLNKYFIKTSRDQRRNEYFTSLDNTPELMIIKYGDIKKSAEEDDDGGNEWEIISSNLLMQAVIGEGAFGIVRKGLLSSEKNSKVDVAIKMLKDCSSFEEIRQLYQEIEIMKTVPPHPHLVSMIGCVTKTRPDSPLLIVEFCAYGDLQKFLRNAWDLLNNQIYQLQDPNGYDLTQQFSNKLYDFEYGNPETFYIQPKTLISYARQVALGMEELSRLKLIHRDLATRNVLVCDYNTVKISDFGLSRDVYRDNVYCKTGNGKLPIRWMALESMTHQRYTSASDVWSFGILLWEIITLGATPYPGVRTKNLLDLLVKGYRMNRPPNCSEELYAIMEDCWKASPKDRPSFTDLRISLETLLENVSQYLSLNTTKTENQDS